MTSMIDRTQSALAGSLDPASPSGPRHAFQELAILFPCERELLVGVATLPSQAFQAGIVVVVGGPQYRVGSHRQFVHLSRQLAASGIASFRFDYRGMGDSSGAMRSFEDVSQDLAAALDVFLDQVPGLRHVFLWGLCDGASAACLFAHLDPRVAGLVLLNPWVHTEAQAARVYLKRYYVRRLLHGDFWAKLLAGRVNFATALRSLLGVVSSGLTGSREKAVRSAEGNGQTWPDCVAWALQRFRGPRLLILSGKDHVAAEFQDLVAKSKAWQLACTSGACSRVVIPDANHTFSRSHHKTEVASATATWIAQILRSHASSRATDEATASGATG